METSSIGSGGGRVELLAKEAAADADGLGWSEDIILSWNEAQTGAEGLLKRKAVDFSPLVIWLCLNFFVVKFIAALNLMVSESEYPRVGI